MKFREKLKETEHAGIEHDVLHDEMKKFTSKKELKRRFGVDV
jgi:hypothetical protein